MKHETPSNLALQMQDEVYQASKDINNVLTSAYIVRPIFHTHYVQMETGQFGIKDLVCRILKEREAIFPQNVGNTELRSAAIAASLFSDEVNAEVKERFTAGSCRYPEQTIRATLSVTLFKLGLVGKIQLTTHEDSDRPSNCKRPRCKYFLIRPKDQQ